jgi:hypothetical protein
MADNPGAKFYPKHQDRDHVLVQITLSVMIGVEEEEEDLPGEFTNLVREKVKETGAIILTSSIVPQKRRNYLGSAREGIMRAAGLNKNHPLHIEEDKEKEKDA